MKVAVEPNTTSTCRRRSPQRLCSVSALVPSRPTDPLTTFLRICWTSTQRNGSGWCIAFESRDAGRQAAIWICDRMTVFGDFKRRRDVPPAAVDLSVGISWYVSGNGDGWLISVDNVVAHVQWRYCILVYSSPTSLQGCSGLVVEYRTRNQEAAGSTLTRSTASNLAQVGVLRPTQPPNFTGTGND